jgi:glycosyltransferase involved in cell wall biosynthesis
LRVSFVLPGYPWHPVGGFRVVYEYANGLADRGHQVAVIHPRRLPGIRRPPPTGMIRRLLRPVGNLRLAVRQRLTRPDLWWQEIHPAVEMRYVAAPVPDAFPDADVVFATAWQTVQHVDSLPGARGRKFYLVMDFPPYLGPADAVAHSWQRPLSKVAISAWLETLVRDAGGGDVLTIPIGIGDAFHAPLAFATGRSPEDGPAGRREEGRGGLRGGRRARVAMMVGHSPYKAWRDGLEALRLAWRRVPRLEAELFGAGPKPRDLDPWIRYHHNLPQAELIALLDRADVFVCSSLAEGFALPPAEAALRGCAIVTTDCGGNREYATHGDTALVSPPADPTALADNLVAVLEDPALRARLADRGRERLGGFTWDAAVARLEARMLARAE